MLSHRESEIANFDFFVVFLDLKAGGASSKFDQNRNNAMFPPKLDI